MKNEVKAINVIDEAASLYWEKVKGLTTVLKRLSLHDIRTIFSEAVVPAIGRVRELDRESSRSPGCSIALPVITDEMWDMFSETSLMTFDRETGKPHWTQDAVDFACVLAGNIEEPI